MTFKIVAFIVANLWTISIHAQDFEWEGYGKGLSYLKISNDNVLFNCYIDSDPKRGNIKEITDQLIIFELIDEVLDTHQLQIRILNRDYDSLSIGIQGVPVIYYKPEHLKYLNRYRFEELSLEYLNNYGPMEFKIEFNRYGRIRYADRENKTLFEATLDTSYVEKFKALIKYIDIVNFNQSHGRTNMCDNKEFIFTFKDFYRNEYKYRAIYVPPQLNMVKEYLEGILNSYGHKIVLPKED